jgi:hypothetical protein
MHAHAIKAYFAIKEENKNVNLDMKEIFSSNENSTFNAENYIREITIQQICITYID